MKLPQTFFSRPADEVARDLLGKILVRRVGRKTFRCRIVETEAYMGVSDLACHASKGLTKRTQALFGPPGRAYVYLCYGLHQMLNIVAKESGHGHAILLRAAEPLDGWDVNLTGPGNLARGLKITPADNARDLTGDRLWLEDAPPPRHIGVTPRIGVDYAKHWKDAPLRFYDWDSQVVSRRKKSEWKQAPPARRDPVPSPHGLRL